MTIDEKREAIMEHCNKTETICSRCKINIKNKRKGIKDFECHIGADDSEVEENYALLFENTEAADERGDNVMESQTVTISLERYEELILKEALCNKLTVDKDVTVFLIERLEEKANV